MPNSPVATFDATVCRHRRSVVEGAWPTEGELVTPYRYRVSTFRGDWRGQWIVDEPVVFQALNDATGATGSCEVDAMCL